MVKLLRFVLLAGAMFFPVVCIAQQSFQEGFENGSSWLTRWTVVCGPQVTQTAVVHSGSQALKMGAANSPPCGCGSIIYRTGFSESTGEYSAWYNDQNPNAGGSIYIQVQPGDSIIPEKRVGYVLYFEAQNASHPTFSLSRLYGNGVGVSLGSLAPKFMLNEWVKVFIRRNCDSTLIAGYQLASGERDSIICIDTNAIVNAGSFYLAACSVDNDPIFLYNYYDDIEYKQLNTGPRLTGPCCDTVPEGSSDTILVTASDCDGDSLVLGCFNLPPFASCYD